MTCTAEVLLQDLTALVDDLKVVSYKWLARQYHIASNFAKQVLYRFVQEQGNRVKAIHLVSGYLKADPSQHIVRLVDGSSLEGCQAEFASLTGVHVHSVMPAERQPVTDAGRLCAEDAEQARHFYQAIVKQNALAEGSVDVFAKNAISSIKFNVDIQHLVIKQQQQHGLQTGARSPGVPTSPAAAVATTAAVPARAADEVETPNKRQRAATDATATDASEALLAEGAWQIDPVSGEEVWMDIDNAEQQQQEGPDAEPAVDSHAGAQGTGAGAAAVPARSATAATASGSSKAATGKAGSGRVGRRGSSKGGVASGRTQKNIMSFFGKR